ncbi:MAG: hypothetical protein PHF37_00720 [Phycisphaerae bacterium]|nr:hypothetical protein [Phycisphaerae bacterium]
MRNERSHLYRFWFWSDPIEEAKLYGHNAIHASLAYLGAYKGYKKMVQLKTDKRIMKIAADAFIKESGAALIKKYADLNDELFTEKGYKAFADDLLSRMTNPYLDDTIERAARDPERKLGANDRIFGTMRLALEYGIEPENMAIGAAAGLIFLLKAKGVENITNEVLSEEVAGIFANNPSQYDEKLIALTQKAFNLLKNL